MTNEELADDLTHHCPVGNPTQCKCLFCVSARRLRERDGERIEDKLGDLFYAYEDTKKALAKVLYAYDELATLILHPQEPDDGT